MKKLCSYDVGTVWVLCGYHVRSVATGHGKATHVQLIVCEVLSDY